VATQRAFLLIADIGGYTRFMKVHRINLAHSQDIIAQLLEAVIDGASPRLELAKLEGDAAFFYALMASDNDDELAKLAKQVAGIRRAFLARQQDLAINRYCTCEGCVGVSDLTLKFVAHAGEVAFQKVKRFVELAGVDVILVHRMLKNSVPIAEYMLMTDKVNEGLAAQLQARTVSIDEDFEGLGRTLTHFLDLNEVPDTKPSELAPSFIRKIWGWMAMEWRSIPYFLGLKKPCDNFRNNPNVS
jgi:hypothetical protein